MYNMYGMDPSMFGDEVTLVLNAKHPLVQYVLEHKEGEHTGMFCQQLYDLAMLSNKPLNPEAMTKFITRSNEIMMLLAKQVNQGIKQAVQKQTVLKGEAAT